VTTRTTDDRLLDVAEDLFYRHGITATGVDQVVRAAGLSKPTLYARFGSKSTLVRAVLERRHARRAAELAAWVADIATADRPLAVFSRLAETYVGDGGRGCAFLLAAAELPDASDPARLAVRREKQWLRDAFTELATGAGLRGPKRLGSQLLLLLDGLAGRVSVDGPQAAGEAVADAIDAAAELLAAAGQDVR
jgi:AcrR family transcriptional regulator